MLLKLCAQMKDEKLTLRHSKHNKQQISEEFKGHKNIAKIEPLYYSQLCTNSKNLLDKVTNQTTIKQRGVDALTQLCANFSVSYRWCRRPTIICCSILNIAGVNSVIIHQYNKNIYPIQNITKRYLLTNLGKALVKSQIEHRDVRILSRKLGEVVLVFGGTPHPSISSEPEITRKVMCYICPR